MKYDNKCVLFKMNHLKSLVTWCCMWSCKVTSFELVCLLIYRKKSRLWSLLVHVGPVSWQNFFLAKKKHSYYWSSGNGTNTYRIQERQNVSFCHFQYHYFDFNVVVIALSWYVRYSDFHVSYFTSVYLTLRRLQNYFH